MCVYNGTWYKPVWMLMYMREKKRESEEREREREKEIGRFVESEKEIESVLGWSMYMIMIRRAVYQCECVCVRKLLYF